MAQDNPRKGQRPYPHYVEEQIRRCAYELYESRGREDGHELEDWLTAEQEVTAKNTRTAAA